VNGRTDGRTDGRTFCFSGPTRDTTPPAPKCGCVHVRDNIIDITQLGVTWTEGLDCSVRLQGSGLACAAGAPTRGASLAWGHCCAEILLYLYNNITVRKIRQT
jgi:hypothetical protein